MLGLGNNLARGGGVLSGLSNTYSLNFDGTDDSIDFGRTFDELGAKAQGSLSIWIKTTSESGAGNVINDRGVTSGNKYLQMSVNDQPTYPDYTLSVSWEGGSNMYRYRNAWDVWNHFVITWHVANESRILYTNATTDVDGTKTDAFVFDADKDDIRAGMYGAGAGFFTGLMDEIGIWNKQLDADAVTAIYNSGKPIALDADSGNYDNSGDLVGWWRFEEGSGTSVADSSTNSNAGTISGSASWSTDVP